MGFFCLFCIFEGKYIKIIDEKEKNVVETCFSFLIKAMRGLTPIYGMIQRNVECGKPSPNPDQLHRGGSSVAALEATAE